MSTLLKTIRAKLMFAMGALAVIAAGLALYGIYEAHNLNQEIEFMTGTVTHRMIYLGRANEAFLDYYRFQKNHLLEADPVAKQKWEKEQVGAEARLNQALANWENVASDLEKQKITIIREAFDDFKEANARILVLSKSSQLAKAREVSNGAAHQAYQRADKALGEATELAENAMRNQADEAAATYARTRRLMVIITIVAVGGCCSLSFLLVGRVVKRFDLVLDRIKDVAQGDGDLTKRVEVHTDDELGQLGRWFNTFMDKLQRIILQLAQSTEHIASAAEELSSTATQTSRSTATQKDQTTQVAAAMQQMSSTMVQVSENATRASENARRGGETARSGGVIVEETIEVIQNLAASTRDTAAKIQELGKSSDQIGQIIGVIDDIADQTNLLALNAAIEAARAGEQGRGFAVVADEVRKLAERTMHATKEIAQMIKTIQSETQHAVEAMQSGTVAVERGVETATKAGASLNEIIQASELVNDMITQIATAATEQSAATQQVRSNMDQIASLVQESSVGAEQSAKACVDLSDLALDLQQLVARFKLGEDSQAPAGSIRPSSPRGLEPEMHPLPGLPRQTRVTVQ